MVWLHDYPLLSFLFGSLFAIAVGWKAVKELLTTYREQVGELRVERDDYRNNLHATRNSLQAAQNRVNELELQPNLGTLKTLIEGQTLAMAGIGQSGTAMAESLKEHMNADHMAFNAINKNLETISSSMSSMFKMLKSHDSRVAQRVRKARGQ